MSEENKSHRPGQKALENMKLIQSETTVFKVPKVFEKKIKARKTQVLDKDIYFKGISKLIERDFFPDLKKLKAQNDYLEAVENKDYGKLKQIMQKYSGNRPPTDPYNSPATFDTPDSNRPYTPSAGTPREQGSDIIVKDKPNDIIDNHTLDSFLATHKNEESNNYEKIIEFEDKKRATKFAQQIEAEETFAALADAAVLLPSIEQQADQTERPHEVDTWRFKAKNYIMYVPDGAASQNPPPKPTVVHENTHLKVDPFDHARSKQTISELAKNQVASVSGKIGVDGMSVSVEKPPGEYSLVATPSPRPGTGPDESPLMTWGQIEGTPFRLDGGDTPLPAVGAGAAYKMLEVGARERIAIQLTEQVARRRRPTTPRVAPPTPSYRTTTERLASMSPAARKLAAKYLVSPRLKLTSSRTGIISHGSTPKRTITTPQSKNVATPKRIVTPKRNETPVTATTDHTSVQTSQNNNLTDNLLQINLEKRTRLKAQDFFK